MQSLNSKNYESYCVQLRNENDPILMSVSNGSKLSEYLVTQHNTSHVGITDIDGHRLVVRVTDILRVEPIQAPKKKIEDYI